MRIPLTAPLAANMTILWLAVVLTISKIESGISLFIKLGSLAKDSSQSKCIDVGVIGAGIGGLSAASILNANYGVHTEVFESHYRPGGVSHSFQMKARKGDDKAIYEFDAGPTIMLGCSSAPLNPLQQVLSSIGAGSEIDWIQYQSWGMRDESGGWNFVLGEGKFESEIARRDGEKGVNEFKKLREACLPLCSAAADIPTMALRSGKWKLLPLLPHYKSLQKVIPFASELDGSFAKFMDTYISRGSWLEHWLDALAFSLSGLPARETGAAAMAYTLFDLHRDGGALDYPRGGMGKIASTFVKAIKESGGNVHLSSPVDRIIIRGGRAIGLALESGEFVRCRRGVICNAPVWTLETLLRGQEDQLSTEQRKALLDGSANLEATKSFLHLHLGLDASGLDLSSMQPHFTVMSQGLGNADPCADRNMVCVSNPSVLDSSLVNKPDKMVVHSYGAGNEDYEQWTGLTRGSPAYEEKKTRDSAFLYESVSRALGISVEEVKLRAEVDLPGTPLTHEYFNRRHRGTYGAAWSSMLRKPETEIKGLLLAGDSVFPGIGVPAVALSGATAANTMVSVGRHLLATR